LGAQLFRKKDIDQLISDSENPEKRLSKSLGWLSLTSLGIGAVIGAGIFTIVGTAIAGQKLQFSSVLNAPLLEYLIYHSASFGRPGAGPAIALSFVLVGIVCAFAALCYAELAAMIPIAGSAYTYTYATMGELIAWIIGWDLILEYAVSNMAVSVGFSAHVVNLLDWFGVHPDLRWITPAYLPAGLQDLQGNTLYAPGWHFGFNHRHAAHHRFGPRHPRIGQRQQHHGRPENHGHHGLCDFRLALRSPRQLASLFAQRLARRSHRRLDHLLYVHRI
jgi:APA family basic amino acid/polyamine antiporter